ncbi:hypothetical protein CSB45_08680 [candidate division KSB3 bacterium]|uniref:Nucleotidyltransferase-Associated Rossmannoid Fold domain-containing protein n=1 Tax=candidate division KSB3 bacterium TaxID=2044937 RepID=A0A2G6E4J4_9BACT|nr:MAG: hypothetical protein CSB45_08680 [candidate division KSB3 bacterium]PIE29704.1 MAG: hypothetical protein CSA57_07755 [candidate division KSB3 bacterium]
MLILIVIGKIFPASAQETQIEKLEARIETLENRLDIKNEFTGVSKELREQKFTLIEQKHAQAIKELRVEQEAFKNKIHRENNLVFVFGAVILTVGIGSYIGLIKSTRKKIAGQVEEVLRTGGDNLQQLIESQAIETLLKKKKKLLVISGSDTNMTKMERQLHAMKFKHVESRLLHNVFDTEQDIFSPDFHEKRYDLIVFNQLTEDEINRYVERSERDVFVGFSYQYLNNITERAKLNFANSLFTLYTNIMNVLKYQHIIES